LAAAISAALAAAHAAKAQQLEEIIVTAERRELNLQDTPISVMSFEGDALELRGIDDMFELATIAPNLDIKGSRGTGNTSPTFEIRGISGGGGATGERSVGYYVDNVFMPRTTGPVMRLIDVERVEVLRGPQGTLFGRNSTGGAIRVFSRQPENEFDANLRLTLGSFDRQDLQGMINVPLGDNLALRAQAASMEQDGIVTRGPQSLGNNDDTVARVQLKWDPTDTLSLKFGAMHSDSKSDGSPTDMTFFNMNPVCPLPQGGPYYCLQGNYADWVSDFLQNSGQERLRQDAKWGEQNHPDGTGPERSWGLDDPGSAREIAEVFREETDHKAREGKLTWRDIALEEIAEAFAEDDPELLRAELNQVSAVFAAWAEAITRRVS